MNTYYYVALCARFMMSLYVRAHARVLLLCMRACVQAECCGIMGVVSTEHATGNDPANDARALLLEVCTSTIYILYYA